MKGQNTEFTAATIGDVDLNLIQVIDDLSKFMRVIEVFRTFKVMMGVFRAKSHTECS